MPAETEELTTTEIEEVVETPEVATETTTPDAVETTDEVVTTDDAPARDLSKVSFSAFKQKREEVEPVKELPEVPPAEVKPAAVKKTSAKDYTGIEEGDKLFFKEMSNDTFIKQKAIYLENKELKKQIETVKTTQPAQSNYYTGHPEAYKLSDDYINATTVINVANDVENHLINQLDKISKGEQYEDITADNNGTIFRAGKLSEPSERARFELEEKLRHVRDAKYQHQNKIKDLSGNYNKSYQQDITLLKETEEKFFPGYDKPDHATSKVQKAFLEILPPTLRNSPLASTLAKTVANNAIFKKEKEDALKKVAELEAKLAKVSPGAKGEQPGKGKTLTGGGSDAAATIVGNRKVLNFSEIMRRKKEGI